MDEFIHKTFSTSKNRNYRIFKKVNLDLLSVVGKHGYCEELVIRLRDKKSRAHKRSCFSANESSKANLRAKNAYFNTVNKKTQNYEISAKKKFSILTKHIKNQKSQHLMLL